MKKTKILEDDKIGIANLCLYRFENTESRVCGVNSIHVRSVYLCPLIYSIIILMLLNILVFVCSGI